MTRNELKRFKALEEALLSTKEKLEEAIKGKDSWYKDYKEVKKPSTQSMEPWMHYQLLLRGRYPEIVPLTMR